MEIIYKLSYLKKGESSMTTVFLYSFIQCREYSLNKIADDFEKVMGDDFQGVIFHEYNEEFLKATYWQRRKRKDYKYCIEKGAYVEIEEETVNVAEFEIYISEKKLIVFGNKQMAQKIISMIGIVSQNSYSINEYIINIEQLVEKVCHDESIELIKMKLIDIVIDRGLLVNCNVNLQNQNNPVEIAMKYIKNIVVLSFKFQVIRTSVTIYRTGKVLIGKIAEEDKKEVVEKIMQFAC